MSMVFFGYFVLLSDILSIIPRTHAIPRCWTLRKWFRPRNQFPQTPPIPGIGSLQVRCAIKHNILTWYHLYDIILTYHWYMILSFTLKKNRFFTEHLKRVRCISKNIQLHPKAWKTILQFCKTFQGFFRASRGRTLKGFVERKNRFSSLWMELVALSNIPNLFHVFGEKPIFFRVLRIVLFMETFHIMYIA
jgi:hypothetical protein